MNDAVRVFAPATVANVGVGFDILGFALDRPGDEIIVKWVDEPGLRISEITGTGDKQLPLAVEENTAGFAAQRMLEYLGESRGIEMAIHKKMPFGSGLGSSAASAAAGVMAINELLGQPLSKREMLGFAVAGEEIADGAYHADNVAPSLLGGIVFIRDNATLDVHELPVPDDLYAAVLYPSVEILTKDARDVLSDQVSLRQSIEQNGNLGAMLIALYEQDYELLGRSLHDVIIEPQRASLIPHFAQVKAAALSAGALGASISGAGPSMFALCRGAEVANRVGVAMQAVYASTSIITQLFVSPINKKGAIRIS
ncbi:MAG: homoserine kinase [Lewinella sp.]|nr:homoserine kinase [Lewinella sp.]